MRGFRPEQRLREAVLRRLRVAALQPQPRRRPPDEHPARSLRRRPRRAPAVAPVRGVRRRLGADPRRRAAALRREQAGDFAGAPSRRCRPARSHARHRRANARLAASLPLWRPARRRAGHPRARSRRWPAPVRGPDGRTRPGTPAPGRSSAADCPPEVNPSLWRQARLNAEHGLFEVRRRRLPGARRRHLQHHVRRGRDRLDRRRRRSPRRRPPRAALDARDRAPRRAPGDAR